MWFWKRLRRATTTDKAIAQPLDGRRVLLIDDNYDQQRLMATLLMKAGARVDLECNGQSALETLSRQAGAFDAVVCDFLMPVLDGQETTRRMREMGPSLPTIGVTAHADPAVHRAWLASGCDVVLEKPLHASDFIATVADAIAKRGST